MLKYIPFNRLVSTEPRYLKLIPDDSKTQEMCNGDIEEGPWLIHYVRLHVKTQEICSRAV